MTPIYTVTVKSQISGYLMQVLYTGRANRSAKATLLAEIDPRPYQVMLEQAQAGLARDQANLENAKVDLARYQTLAPLKAIPEQQLATQQALVKSDAAVHADGSGANRQCQAGSCLLPYHRSDYRSRGPAP